RWQERGSGHFVFISSISGFAATSRMSVYAATKFGLRGFALNLREDLRASGKSEICVAPLRQRALARVAMLAPEIIGRVAGSVAARSMDAIVAGQTDKR
ncbi:MAG: SDR family NAD(P)-dependent oxidoreductase, partial [Mycobacterium sp.]